MKPTKLLAILSRLAQATTSAYSGGQEDRSMDYRDEVKGLMVLEAWAKRVGNGARFEIAYEGNCAKPFRCCAYKSRVVVAGANGATAS